MWLQDPHLLPSHPCRLCERRLCPLQYRTLTSMAFRLRRQHRRPPLQLPRHAQKSCVKSATAQFHISSLASRESQVLVLERQEQEQELEV